MRLHRPLLFAGIGFLLPFADAFTTTAGFALGAEEANSLARVAQDTVGLLPYCVLLAFVFAAVGWFSQVRRAGVLGVVLRGGLCLSLASYAFVLARNVTVVAEMTGEL